MSALEGAEHTFREEMPQMDQRGTARQGGRLRTCLWVGALVAAICCGCPVTLGWWGVTRALGVRHELGWIDAERRKLPPWEPLPTPSDNALEAYEQAFVLLPAGGRDAVCDWQVAFAQEEAAEVARLLPEARACVAQSAAALAKLHEAAGQEYVSPAVPDIDQPKDWLARHDDLACFAPARAYAAHLDGDDRTAFAAVEDGYALGVKAPRGGGLREADAGAAYVAIVQRLSTSVLLSGTAPADALRAHARRMREIRGEVWPFERTVRFERARSLSAANAVATRRVPAHRLYMADDELPGPADRARNWMLAAGASESREWLEDRYARYVEELDKPVSESRFRELAKQSEADMEVRHDRLAELLMPDFDRAVDRRAETLVDLAADETIACLEVYKKENGSYPASLETLVPSYMPEVPLDPWTGKPLIYRLTPERYMLYAVGPNGLDDGGVSEWRGSTEPDLVIVPVPPWQ
jgi:hypothetical protein